MDRPPPSTIPDAPGSYQFRDRTGTIIYVGKARSLRSRLSSYFADARTLSPKTAQMMGEAASVEWIQVGTDPDAVMLEYSLIKEHRPRYNVQLRDDKSYPYLAITTSEEWPRPMVVRGARKKGIRYFGPYANAGAIRDTLDLLVRSLPLRTCSEGKFRRHLKLQKPCLLYHIDRCSGPCIGAVDQGDYRRMVDEMCSFLEGESGTLVSTLTAEMKEAAGSLEFEKAARLRDRLAAATAAGERQQMVTTSAESFDVFGIAEDELEASVQMFRVRKGHVVGRWGAVLDRVDGTDSGAVVGHALSVAYSEEHRDVPPEVLVPDLPADGEVYESWLSTRRGGRVTLRVPHRGEKRSLQETVALNARDELVRTKLKRGLDHASRTDALAGLREALALNRAPLRIECYDMSHLQGSDYVGSMVVMEDGVPVKKEYRHFRVRSVLGNDDYAAMREVLARRLARRDDPRFSRLPDLLVVDGGKGQLGVAVSVLDELGLTEEVPVAALAKRYEEVFLPGRAAPVELARGSGALHLLQRVRDEAHRFAVSYHRTLRGKRMVAGALDGVPGLGEVRRHRLVEELGGMGGVAAASREDLARLSWLPPRVAEAVYAALHG